MTDTATIVRALADLAPTGREQLTGVLDVTSGGRPFHWLGGGERLQAVFRRPNPMASSPLFALAQGSSHLTFDEQASSALATAADRKPLRRLAAVDAIHGEEQLLRLGWVWLTGTATVDGEERHLLHPLLSVPMRVLDSLTTVRMVNAGDAELTPLVTGPTRSGLEALADFGSFTGWQLDDEVLRRRFPEFTRWITSVVEAAGLPPVRMLGPTHEPRSRKRGAELVAVIGMGAFLARDTQAMDLPTTLRNWAGTTGIEATALAQVVGGTDRRIPRRSPTPPHEPPLVLTDAQRDAVHRARHQSVSVVSGPPGTGKSHTVAAIALDAVAAGQSVLVATQTEHAADVLTAMFERHPGPVPVAFGGGVRRSRLAAELTNGIDRGVTRSELATVETAVAAAHQRRDWLRGAVRDVLALEQRAAAAPDTDALVPLLTQLAPGAFELDADLEALAELADRAATPATGWWSRRGQARAERRLRRRAGARPDTPTARLTEAIAVATARRAAARLAAEGGTVVGTLWGELEAADAELATAVGAALTDRCRSGAARSARARAAVGDLATALRAGRVQRRDHLRHLDAEGLLDALPVWVGTLRDIDDLLPAQPGLFDLVILDEASQIDLPRAAVGLLRASRAVVVGDPHQLRHVSFVADVDVEATLDRHGLADLRNRLDVRRVSALDAATTVAPTLWLNEHFRSAPHLIEFSAERFYPATVHVATRHPANEDRDAIDTVHVDGRRDESGVNRAEIEAAVATVRRLADEGVDSIGLLSPFRAQVDALGDEVLRSFTLEELRRLQLRTGTVHGFQGAERDAIVVSLALDDDSPAGARRFVDDPNLLNVMVTRARRRMIVLTSRRDPHPGLLTDWLRHAEEPPAPPATHTPATIAAPPGRGSSAAPPVAATADPWVIGLADELTRAGLAVRVGYPVGRWAVDLVVGDGDDAVGLEVRVHPSGPSASIDRHLQLRRLGWRLLEAWPSRFGGDPVAAALAVIDELRAPASTA